ncbi:hypothetical protein F5146DRAFT_1059093 [Armillaria mellea]|nr:hypothetical protein F5146DRAFT_1059093 [Armillaria mellea]
MAASYHCIFALFITWYPLAFKCFGSTLNIKAPPQSPCQIYQHGLVHTNNLRFSHFLGVPIHLGINTQALSRASGVRQCCTD